MSDSYLFALGWAFFGAWTALVFILNLVAFGQELFPTLAGSERAQGAGPHDRAKPVNLRVEARSFPRHTSADHS